MLINGKSDNITEDDMLQVAEKVGIKKSDAVKCIEQVRNSVSKWEYFASQTDMSKSNIEKIKNIIGV